MKIKGYKLFTSVIMSIALMASLGGVVLAAPLAPEAIAHTWFVESQALGGCTSWADTCDLQHALDIAIEKDQIWVMEGTYMPSEVGDRSASFILLNGVSLYGGFDGTETALDQRFWATQPSILSGDLLGDDDPTTPATYEDNSYHVVQGFDLSEKTVLDGFTITAGFADTEFFESGGGIYLVNSDPILLNLKLHANQAMQGGGMMLNNSSPLLLNSIIAGNSASKGGGGIYMLDSSPQLVNVTMAFNVADTGGAIALENSTPTLVNAIIWSNKPDQLSSDTATISYSLVQGDYPGTGNLDTDPLFVDLDNHDFHLQTTSPAIEAGDTHAVPEEISTDLDGNRRLVDFDNNGTELVDMGAYEAHHIIFVDQQAVGLDNGSCWDNAFVDLQDALGVAATGNEIWVAQGTYLPSTTNVREASFSLRNDVGTFGGFAGVETDRSQRDWGQNPTVLSGDLGVVGNTSDNSYHVVYNSSITSTARLDGITITAGNADGDNPHYHGGGMYNNNSSPTLSNVTFSNNSAVSGGGMYNESSSPPLTNVTFSDNSAGYGGGMYNESSSPTLTNGNFAGNSSAVNGGGMFNGWSNPTLTTVTFSSNSSAENGGGIFNDNSDPTLTNVTFSGNSASFDGGGMYNYFSSPALTNGNFAGNSTEFGGGMHNYYSSPTLTHVTFSANSAEFNGGGMYNIGSDPELTNVTFSSNSAIYGGGMNNYEFSDPTLTNVTFSANSATYGGGIFNDWSNPTLTNVTLSGNSAIYGGGMYNSESNPTLINSLLWGNSPEQIYNYNFDGSIPVITYSLIQGGYSGEGNISSDPILGPLGDNGGFTLTHFLGLGSPAIDSGSPTVCPLTDQRGVTRPLDGNGDGTARCDMGAYEYESGSLFFTFLPLIVR